MNMTFNTNIRNNYRHTIASCCISYVVQSIVVNFAPLLYLTFNTVYEIPLSKVTLLITITFITQLLTDLLSTKLTDKIGCRPCILFAHIMAAIGFISLGTLPDLLADPFIGLAFACVIYSLGGGLIEVLASPIIESCPSDNKSGLMSLLHSFYCWGTVFVILVSIVFFCFFGTQNWKILTFIWAIIPLFNTVYFILVPIPDILSEEKNIKILSLLKNKTFLLLAAAMLCGGAAEQAVSQWASAFAESSLGISKTLGDLLCPCMFAALMGLSRTLHSKISCRLDLSKYMFISGLICCASYMLTSLSSYPLAALAGCALCGFSCGVFWPGVFSLATEKCSYGGTALFALLALAGDAGCTLGPSIVGFTAELLNENISAGVLAAALFPLLFTVILFFILRKYNKTTCFSRKRLP